MKTVEVVAAIIRQDDRIFATQRGYGDFKGWWEFPGGKVEPGETREQALIREIREELDAEIAIDGYFMTVDYDYETFHLTMHCYLAHLLDPHITLVEHSAAKWLTAEHLDEVTWLPADTEIIDRLKEESRFR